MTPRDYLLTATPRDPEPLGLRALAAVVGAASTATRPSLASRPTATRPG